ncbi:hypothetical protein PL321_07355 [Caloramator sp. mosi_1]|uniref:hypothetical protein n=1 Tax=Caloramator sp. mosi_1 TaxID=3023090 RepID=UPI00235EF98A|nr:hypothetical protein [Caloramator sp. mosi_1]WDC85260.1 hypothetical protein PL321_07355 [Caloramator sp. mosi_1]
MFDKFDFAEFLMGGASSKQSVIENQEKIYRKMEGMLVNVKTDMYNQLVGQVLELIDELFYYQTTEKYKTA